MIAAIVATAYLAAARRSNLPFFSYQLAYGPAVMAACGRGFVNPSSDSSSPLTKFLSQERTRFDCAGLDTNVSQTELTPYQRSERYLLIASALV
ncbi:MAG TPA: hypothetical protein VFP91_02160, partial [Vicinamibacterales bacterium]|nr:hypothetical protein [Vicinamibacterales bacterium]